MSRGVENRLRHDRSLSMTRVDRPYTRRAGLVKKVRNESGAGALARRAGMADRPSVDALEKRQMLFSMVITPNDVDPNTGIGTVRQFFGYVPQRADLLADLPDAQPPTIRDEDFNDEPIGAVGSGQFLLESNVLIRHNVVPGRDIRIGSDQPPPDQSERYMFLDLRRTGEFASFQLFNEGENPTTRTPASQVTFQITGDNIPPATGDLTGIDTDNMVVELLLDNRVTVAFTGAALRAAIQGDAARGTGLFTLGGTQAEPVFDQVRIRKLNDTTNGITPFRLDDMSFTVPTSQFIDQLEWTVGAVAVLSGPIGARADFFDLYGRDMRATIALGPPTGAEILLVDTNIDGQADFNDGIGSIVMSNTDSRTSMTIWGTTIEAVEDQPQGSDFFVPGFSAEINDSLAGPSDIFEEAGVGFLIDRRGDGIIFGGISDGVGDVLIGSPWVRDINNYNPAGAAPGTEGGGITTVTTGFNRADQGIFIRDGSSIGSVYVHGMVLGSSVFTGAVDRFVVGALLGSMTVKGDLGSFSNSADAGMWAPETQDGGIDAAFDTGGQLVVERSVGRIDIGGRSLMDITVVGDLNSPNTRPPRDAFTFYEKEFSYSLQNGTEEDVVNAIVNNSEFVARQPSTRFRGTDQAAFFTEGTYRNDTLMGAEFLNGTASGARIVGDLSGFDPVNGEDTADVFSFATDGATEVVFDITGNIALARVVDSEGRTLAMPELGVGVEQVAFNGTFKFKPTAPGIYYLVLTDGQLDDEGAQDAPYSVAVTGLASVTVGSIRTGASMGAAGISPTINILTGDLGVLRVGTGVVDGGGGDASPMGILNDPEGLDEDDALTFQGATVAVQGSVYGVIAGSDIGLRAPQGGSVGSVRLTIGGDLGMLLTGESPVVGRAEGEGDANFLAMFVGGSIGTMKIRGGIGMDQDNPDDPRAPNAGVDSVYIRTGQAGGAGDIGYFSTGFSVVGDSLNVQVSPGSTVGAFLLAQDAGEYQAALDVMRTDGEGEDEERYGAYDGFRGIPFASGSGSSVRFVDLPRLDLSNATNVRTELFGDQSVQFVDDGGARISISVDGFDEDPVGRVISVPIDGSQGVAVALIDVDLTGGRTLNISGIGTGGSFQIGRIRIQGADENSRIVITGGVEVDIYRIDMDDADTMLEIINETAGGDIVAIDVGGITRVTIAGNLGTSEVASYGPSLIGPELGLEAGLVGEVGGAIGFANDQGYIDPEFGGDIFRPIGDDTADAGNAYLDDVGGPLDWTLNGLIVRTGDVEEVSVKGSIRDVILQGDAATLENLRPNSDNQTAFGGFDGIVGNIYAANMTSIDIGDGLAAPNQGPILNVGIIAADDINEVRSSRTGATINGVINAANNDEDEDNVDGEAEGITSISLDNGLFDGAFIGAMAIDGFWNGLLYADPNLTTGEILSISGTRSNFFRSTVRADTLDNFDLSDAYFDASTIAITGRVENITATGFRNSTLLGGPLELEENIISTSGDLVNLTAQQDIEDLVLDVTGSLLGRISARHITRSTLDVDNTIEAISVSGSVKSSAIVGGELKSLNASQSIESSSIAISGPINSINAGVRIANTDIEVTGPNGRIDSVTARDLVSGDISASGPINSIQATQGDLVANIVTTTSQGNVSTLRAGRDIVAFTDISGNLNSLIAGRNIGAQSQKGVVLVRGNLTSASAANGQLYSDLRSGGRIDTVTIGRVVNKPGNVQLGTGSIISFGRLGSVNVTGDFNGDIISYSGGIGTINISNGSFLPGRTIAAFSGELNALTVSNGNLLGNVIAGYDIKSLSVTGASDGVFGNVGVVNGVSQFTSYDSFRNQLPPGVQQTVMKDGPSIIAGKNIVSINVAGSVAEAVFQAGRAIQNITIAKNVLSDSITSGYTTAFVAGDSIDGITISGNADHAQFLAGVVGLGADGRAGGIGANADLVKSGNIARVTVSGAITNSQFLAGVDAGVDGAYGSGDDRVALGFSNIATLNLGSANNVLAQGDSLSASVAGDARLIRITEMTSVDPILDNGQGTPGAAVVSGQAIAFQAGTVTFTLSGPGQAFFDTSNGRLTLRNTTSASTLVVTSSLTTLNNLSIVTNDDASLGSLRVTPAVTGTSQFVIDGTVGTLDLGAFSGAGRITVGDNITNANLSTFTNGTLSARNIQSLNVTGDFGAATPGSAGRPVIRALSGGSMAFRGAMRGTVSVDRDLASVTMNGLVDRADVRVGATLNSLNASAGVSRLVVSAGQSIGSVSITGNAFDSAFLAGIDLGTDAAFGGTGTALDRAAKGSIGSVNVSGNFQESDIIAGYLRGADGFYGTSDDTVAAGLSTIGNVTIGGGLVGSTRFSESYRIASSGDVGTVRVGGTNMTTPRGNFALEAGRGQLVPTNIRPIDIVVRSDSGQYVAELNFNQPVDFSTIKAGLSVSEVRGSIDVTIRLIEGTDYTVNYNASSNTVLVRFSRDLTSRNLPSVPGQPGPGIYRFQLDQAIVRGKSLAALVDGNNDGFSTVGDNYVGHAIVGDVGDKFFEDVAQAGTGSTATFVDFYAPADLDFILDDLANTDGLPDPNQNFVIRGNIGDHPDNDAINFPFAGDSDIYSLTLQAGQILRLSAIRGAATSAPITLVDPDGNILINLNVNGQGFGQLDSQDAVVTLPAEQEFIAQNLISDSAFLIKSTGQYSIIVGQIDTVDQPGAVPGPETVSGAGLVGSYEFDLYIFDDADTGFSSSTNSGNGTGIVNAPEASFFAGADTVLGTADDLGSVTIGDYTFTIAKGTDNVWGTSDDLISGSNLLGYTSTRTNGVLTNTISSSIGPAAHAGVPGDIFADLDVYQLNNGAAIAPGTTMRVTVKLSQTGSNLGSSRFVGRFDSNFRIPTDESGNVNFGLFETTGLDSVDDSDISNGKLVFSPTDFKPFSASGSETIADNGFTKYGYDANGDYYIEFVTPDSVVNPGFSGNYALYLQGVFNADYTLEVVTTGTGGTVNTGSQNFLIETNGGSVDWLEVGGATTDLARFSAASVGFRGFVTNNQNADEYILSNLVAQLNDLFSGEGYDITFSTNPADFEFQPFSTIYLSSTTDPINSLFESFDLSDVVPLPGQALQNTAIISTQPFGFSEHADPFNTDLEDDAVVFAPTFSLLGLSPSLTDVDVFTDSLTGAVARRAGELLGLRLNADDLATNPAFDFQAANSASVFAGFERNFAFPTADRQLSSGFDSVSDTNFFLGRQNTVSLLDKILTRI